MQDCEKIGCFENSVAKLRPPLCREWEEEILALLEAEPRQGGSDQSLDSWPGPCFLSLNEVISAAPTVTCGLENQVIMVGVVPITPFMVYRLFLHAVRLHA